MGQNLAASAGFKQTGQQVVDAWMSEEKDYNPASPSYSHFTREYLTSNAYMDMTLCVCRDH
jgi:hypothetical protein